MNKFEKIIYKGTIFEDANKASTAWYKLIMVIFKELKINVIYDWLNKITIKILIG